ncbi:uncharacterized protein EKO05_0009994 [Ascochyta rabiei]|nr:uncharacterized protein EKO05_0009994 [Ascochyta rabiei]UPX19741.1 hypothetical protein EKO05_0009994 [Ascochyta rabiei]
MLPISNFRFSNRNLFHHCHLIINLSLSSKIPTALKQYVFYADSLRAFPSLSRTLFWPTSDVLYSTSSIRSFDECIEHINQLIKHFGLNKHGRIEWTLAVSEWNERSNYLPSHLPTHFDPSHKSLTTSTTYLKQCTHAFFRLSLLPQKAH